MTVTVDTTTGEVAVDLDATEARHLTDRIRQTLSIGYELIVAAERGRAWIALGYADWDSYCAGEFESSRMVRLPREQRREVVVGLAREGMSSRSIGSALGVGEATVRRDIATASDDADDFEPLPPSRGQDGRTRPRQAAEPAATPKRRPLPDAFFDAALDATKVVERLERLVADDRFTSNAGHLASKHYAELHRTRDALDLILAALKP